MAKKQQAETIDQTATTPAENVNAQSTTTEQPAQDATSAPTQDELPAQPAPPTQEDLEKKANDLLAQASSESDPVKGFELMKQAYAAKKAVIDFINAAKAAAERAKIDAELEARAAIVDELIAAYDAYLAAKAVYDDYRSKTPADIEALNAVYHAYTDKLTAVKDAVKKGGGNVKVVKELHVPMGATGTQVRRAGVGTEILDMYKAKRAAGLSTSDAAKEIIAAGYARGTTHSVILAYRREIGEVQ